MAQRPAIPDLIPLARRLESVRRAYGVRIGNPKLTREEFAEVLGTPAPRYRRYERAEIEPSMALFRNVRDLTGVSIDWLMDGASSGVFGSGTRHVPITAGQRLRWIRELNEPLVATIANIAGVTKEEWEGFESDEPIPLFIAFQMKHRFEASLDYLYFGEMGGLLPEIVAALLAKHPEMTTATHLPGVLADSRPTPRPRRAPRVEPETPAAAPSAPALEVSGIGSDTSQEDAGNMPLGSGEAGKSP